MSDVGRDRFDGLRYCQACKLVSFGPTRPKVYSKIELLDIFRSVNKIPAELLTARSMFVGYSRKKGEVDEPVPMFLMVDGNAEIEALEKSVQGDQIVAWCQHCRMPRVFIPVEA